MRRPSLIDEIVPRGRYSINNKARPEGASLIVALLLLCAVLADVIMPYDPLQIGAGQRMQPPSWSHPAGTDQLGRDVFSRVIKGSQIALVVSPVAIGLSLAIGILFGLIAGYGPR
jgi:peptide/nickel transport system permease protein